MNARAGGWVVGALAMTVFALSCTKAEKSVPAGIAWNKAYQATLTDARANHRPILLDFYTDW